MIEIPQQLHNPEFRFVKVRPSQKRAFENNWQKTNNYTYDNPQLAEHLKNKGNYGVCCGFGSLLVIDADSPQAVKTIEGGLPETFTIKTGGGGKHFFYICKGINKKIILENKDKKIHYGEVQAKGTYVVGPNSVHPNGNGYTIEKPHPITEIKAITLRLVLQNLIPKKLYEYTYEKKRYNISYEPDLTSVINTGGFKTQGKRIQGTCPWHGSDTGANFSIDTQKNCWFCYRHWTGGGPMAAIAIMEGIITCDEVSDLRGQKFLEALEKAKEKYGVKTQGNLSRAVKQTLKDEVHPLTVCENFLKEQPIYFDKSKMWWVWNKEQAKWERMDDIDILNILNESLKYGGLINSKIKHEYLTALQMEARKQKPKDAPKTWIQFKDEIVDIETEERILTSPEYFLTNPIPWKIGETEETPIMDKLIKEWVGEEYLETIYEMIAYCLLRDYPIQRIFVQIGSGCNGKGSFLRLLRKFIGMENVTSTDLNRLKERFEPAKLYKKLVCEMGETNITSMRHTSTLKRLTGGDLVRGEFKNKTPFDFVNYAKLIVATNSLPMTMDRTKGFYRRWNIIAFDNEFEDGKEITENIPDEEYENLAKKVVGVLRELLRKRKFGMEGTIEHRKQRYNRYSMPIEAFINKYFEKDPKETFPKGEFNDVLAIFLDKNGYRLLSPQEVNKALRFMGFDIKNKKIGGNAIKCIFGLKAKVTEVVEVNGETRYFPTYEKLSSFSNNFGISSNPIIKNLALAHLGSCSKCKKETFLEWVEENKGGNEKFYCELCARPLGEMLVKELVKEMDGDVAKIVKFIIDKGYNIKEFEVLFAQMEDDGVIFSPKEGLVKINKG